MFHFHVRTVGRESIVARSAEDYRTSIGAPVVSSDREVGRMGRVFVKLRVMPSDVDVDLNRVKDEIARIKISDVEIKDMAIKPIAFGLKAIAVLAVMSDAEGVVDSFIAEIGKIEGVESVEVEDMELL
jgi:elongation factor 1-beta